METRLSSSVCSPWVDSWHPFHVNHTGQDVLGGRRGDCAELRCCYSSLAWFKKLDYMGFFFFFFVGAQKLILDFKFIQEIVWEHWLYFKHSSRHQNISLVKIDKNDCLHQIWKSNSSRDVYLQSILLISWVSNKWKAVALEMNKKLLHISKHMDAWDHSMKQNMINPIM